MDEHTSSKTPQQLPLGESEFPNLRNRGKIYVDKTRMIYELAKEEEPFFLSRPRRFGKSLLLSTFHSLFKFGLRDFSGLEIEKLWKDKNTYTVIHLDLSRVSNFNDIEDFEKKFSSYLRLYLKSNQLLSKDFDITADGIETFAVWRHWPPDSSVVFLLDEYDAPLTSCLNHPDTFIKVRNTLATFYSCLKGRTGAFRFTFLTGITKFGKAGIFSGLNHLDDITLNPDFGDIVGYSLEELKYYFGDYLKNASEILRLSETELIEELVAHYNGFCFEETATKKMFAPWSVLNFFRWPKRGFKNYWFESGGQPSILQEHIKKHSLTQPAEFLEEKKLKISSLSAASSSHKVNEQVLLVQTGYLTIKGTNNAKLPTKTTLYLGYPNQEVADSMADLYLGSLLQGKTLEEVDAGDILQFLAESNVEGFIKRINNAFLALD
ncbi:MAG: AAA family ATPase, partial [Burkholderiales bacterium]|nr:AAA family ATPase [Burkholderiales bacterium]